VTEPATIYVALVDEDVDVWAPVAATPVGANRYRLPDAAPDDETWKFAPGSTVVTEEREVSDGPALVAVALAD
jgi:hypothetical protein